MIQQPTFVFIYLAGLLGLIFWLSRLRHLQPLFRITPAIIYAYFLPTLSTAFGVTPIASPAYDWMVRYLLPVALLLLMVSVDVPAILRLGKTALLMMLAGTVGVIIGGPIALLIFRHWLPPDAWKGLAALSGSWIGGSANLVAIKESVGTPDSLLGPIIVVDTIVAYGWMGILLFLSGWQNRYDRRMRADTSVMDEVTRRLEERETLRHPSETHHLAMILGLGFVGAGVCVWAGEQLPSLGDPVIFSHTTWTICLATALGLALSFTRVSKLEEVGASRVGYVALYLMLTGIGAQADLHAIIEAPLFLVVGVVWLLIHIAILFLVARLLRAPLFFVATGSMANIGGSVSAPVVASVFNPALASVGVLMGVSGYILGIYGGIFCAWLLSLAG